MKEEALSLARGVQDATARLNLVREYLQAFVLRSLHESEAFRALSFVGGTALRFLHHLPRYSEDLDFSLENPRAYYPGRWLDKLRRDLNLAGFEAAVTWNHRKIVHSTWIRVSGILHEIELSALPAQKLSVKLEIDSHPPAGAVTRTRVVQRHMLLALQHHDLPSLMAGKVHALWTRRYLKGRDWFDLFWYLSRNPSVHPNLVLLQNALNQTASKTPLKARQWRQALGSRLSGMDWETLRRDVRLFLERPQEVELLTGDNLLDLLTSSS